MQRKFKLGALAWGIAAVMALPAGAAADNNSADCIQQASGTTAANDQCHESNTATNTQTTTTFGGPGGEATGGNSGPSESEGDHAQADSTGGDASANGGDAEAKAKLENEQANQISGRDSVGDPDSSGSNGSNNSAVCKQQAGPSVESGNTAGNNQCRQDNTATNTQTTTTTGGAGGFADGGDAGPSEATGGEANSQGGDASANGGDAESHAKLDNEQSNAISGRDSGGEAGSNGIGGNNAAVCVQQASGNTAANDQCHQSNTAINTQTTTTTGGAGGTATGGNSGPSLAIGNGAEAGSYGGNASADGGDAESHAKLDSDQSNQISGRDSVGDPDSNGVSGGSNGAVCVQQATGNTTGANQCRQENTAFNTQTTTTTGGAGGSATGGNSGPSLAIGDGAKANSAGGNASANGGNAESHATLENRQSNQISGRDSIGDYSIVVNYSPKHETTTPPTVTVVVVVQAAAPAPVVVTQVKAAVKKASAKKAKAKRRSSKRRVKVKGKAKNCVGNCSAFDPSSGRG